MLCQRRRMSGSGRLLTRCRSRPRRITAPAAPRCVHGIAVRDPYRPADTDREPSLAGLRPPGQTCTAPLPIDGGRACSETSLRPGDPRGHGWPHPDAPGKRPPATKTARCAVVQGWRGWLQRGSGVGIRRLCRLPTTSVRYRGQSGREYGRNRPAHSATIWQGGVRKCFVVAYSWSAS
jgi:hypothetical protein